MLAGKKVLLAVSGSIAAYKAAFFVRLLVKAKAEVKVLMTESAKDFITPLTLATLSKNPVLSEFSDNSDGSWNNHVELGLWADLMIVAPASANTISKMANGICDNLLTAVYLSARCPVMIAPAMDLDMYKHETTLRNLTQLKADGNMLIEAKDGELASGLSGVGRMAEPEELIDELETFFKDSNKLEGHNVLITSGPTQEPIDRVRFIGNRSSGKMGKALAERCAAMGAKVDFISGPVEEYPSHPNIQIHKINTAKELLESAKRFHEKSHLSIFAAAVSDYRTAREDTGKMKRNGSNIKLDLTENPDISLELGKDKRNDQVHVGFALEVEDESSNAMKKLKKKNLDYIVLNSLNTVNAGFGHDTNQVTIFGSDNKSVAFELKNKKDVASDILSYVI